MNSSRKAIAVIAIFLGSCGDPDGAFLGGRAPEKCDGAWPVCDTAAGCKLDDQHYVSGQFPGERRILVRTEQPAEIRVAIFLKSQRAAGSSTEVEWYETGCGARIREAVSGTSFFEQAGERQEFARSAYLSTIGDHFIRVQSDSSADYLLKIDIVAK